MKSLAALAALQNYEPSSAADLLPEGMDALNGGAVDNVIAFVEGGPENVVA